MRLETAPVPVGEQVGAFLGLSAERVGGSQVVLLEGESGAEEEELAVVLGVPASPRADTMARR